MIISHSPVSPQIEYPDEDGKLMAESDAARDYLIYAVETLDIHFQKREDTYVSGNLFIYYEEGKPDCVVSPDAFVIFGVEKRKRRSYKTWEEGDKKPNFVLEITSKSTRSQDQGAKKGIYAFLGVSEYFQYDPTGDYLRPRLQGLRLREGNYFPLEVNALPDGTQTIWSEVLGLELRLLPGGELRFYNPETGEHLLSHREEAQARQAAQARIAELEARLRSLEQQ
ncbi:Uma2 family endonuclease [Phormidium pseudopriestleyi FRX01]|uniref:Uma2 family endonuclease n=1 Tax=Phormidium pseudopriestleyi FRX01 TaxID=1759528 RepID=A0ABS3FX68_9CYAN|nr:Uma2 family endonuclease [Phormidium pseudopriestleyi]MBO0351696.1 Uma2 family endonuclease [Phormidium pseudopriestleyi FRX01]